jgi:hypothetical protein
MEPITWGDNSTQKNQTKIALPLKSKRQAGLVMNYTPKPNQTTKQNGLRKLSRVSTNLRFTEITRKLRRMDFGSTA